MAIIIEQHERRINWFAVFAFLFLFTVIGGGGYYLFFAPTPGIEVITPVPLQFAETLSHATFDPSGILNNPVLKGLRQQGTAPSVGSIGRHNPFLPYYNKN